MTNPNEIEHDKDRNTNALMAITSEILFNVLPLIILTMVLANQNAILSVFYASEWSVTAVIMFGQTIVKIVSSLLETRASVHSQRVAVLITLMIVVGLIPSLVVFVLMITSTEVSIGLVGTQMFLFSLSVVTYFIYGTGIEKHMIEQNEKNKKSQE